MIPREDRRLILAGAVLVAGPFGGPAAYRWAEPAIRGVYEQMGARAFRAVMA